MSEQAQNPQTTPQAAPAPTQAPVAPTPPPPSGAKLTLETYNALYSENIAYHNEVSSLKAKIDELKTGHATQLSEQSERIATLDALTAERDALTERYTGANTWISERLAAKYEGLDEVVKEQIKLEDYADDPLAGFEAIDRVTALVEKLKAGVTAAATSGDDDPLNGTPKIDGGNAAPTAPQTREDFMKIALGAQNKKILKPLN